MYNYVSANISVFQSRQPARRPAVLAALLCSGALMALAPTAAFAQSGPINVPEDEMTDLGTLGGDNGYAYDVSDNGGVVVGNAAIANPDNTSGNHHAFIWTDADGMQDLGDFANSYSNARAVSGDGTTVVGGGNENGQPQQAYLWNTTNGLVYLGTLGGDYSYAYGVNTDGSVVIGHAQLENGDYHAFRATQADGLVDLGTLGGTHSYAYALSGDGSVIVGSATTDGSNNSHAFRWTQATGMEDLGTFGGTYSYARSISRDGTTIVGRADLADNNIHHAFRWTQAGGLQDLGTFGGSYSYANEVSNDGSVIVGHASTTQDNQYHAFRWTEEDGLQDLGTLPGGTYSYGEDISGDGSVIVGYGNLPSTSGTNGSTESHAFRWTQEDGMVDLGTLGGNYSYAYAISNDGTTIVGEARNADGNYRPFIYRTQMQDFTNMIASFPQSASDLEATGEAQRQTLSTLIDAGCSIGSGHSFCVGANGLLEFAKASANPLLAKRNDNAVQISVGARLSPAITVGAGVGFYKNKPDFFSIHPDSGVTFAGWASFAPGGDSLVGPSVKLAIGTANQDNGIFRGAGLDNVMVTPGTAELTTTTIRGTAAYGFDAGFAVVSPIAGLTWQQTKLDAFDEAPGDFPAMFNQTSFDATYATLGAEIMKPVGPDTRVTIGAFADIDLDSDDVLMSGTSTIPGLETFIVQSQYDRSDTRGRFELGLEHGMGPGTVSLKGALRTPTLDGKASFTFGVGFGIGL